MFLQKPIKVVETQIKTQNVTTKLRSKEINIKEAHGNYFLEKLERHHVGQEQITNNRGSIRCLVHLICSPLKVIFVSRELQNVLLKILG